MHILVHWLITCIQHNKIKALALFVQKVNSLLICQSLTFRAESVSNRFYCIDSSLGTSLLHSLMVFGVQLWVHTPTLKVLWLLFSALVIFLNCHLYPPPHLSLPPLVSSIFLCLKVWTKDRKRHYRKRKIIVWQRRRVAALRTFSCKFSKTTVNIHMYFTHIETDI